MGKISFTMDTWSDPDRKSYMAVTAHWIERQSLQTSHILQQQQRINLRVDLLGFVNVSGVHSGGNLATVLLFILDRFQIANKVSLF
jgi:hypothetical protein